MVLGGSLSMFTYFLSLACMVESAYPGIPVLAYSSMTAVQSCETYCGSAADEYSYKHLGQTIWGAES